MTWRSLEEAALALGRTVRTAYRMVEDGRLLRAVTDDGTTVYTLGDGVSPDGDAGDDTSENDVSMAREPEAPDGAAEPPARPRGRPPTTAPSVDRTSARAVREAKARAVLHRLTGPAYLAMIDAAEALDALDEAARAQREAEALLSTIDADDGQASYAGWCRLADAIMSALGDVNAMLERRVVDDARLAGLDRTLRRTERTWQAAREFDCRTAPGGAAAVAAVRRRAQREAYLFGAAAEALRRALIE